MKKESNEDLVRKAKSGDMDAYNKLFERNDRYCFHIAKQFTNISDYDDLVSIARLGMLKAYNAYDVDAGVKFITYASTVIKNEILMYGRKLKRMGKGREVYLDSPLTVDNQGNELTYGDILESGHDRPEEIYSKREELQILRRLISNLQGREKAIIKGIYFENKTQEEIAEELNLSQSYISRLVEQILIKLRNDFDRVNVYSENLEGGGDVASNKLSDEKIGKMCYLFAMRKDNKVKMSFKDIAEKLDVSLTTVRNYHKKYKNGELRNYKVIPVILREEYLAKGSKDIVLDESKNLMAGTDLIYTESSSVKKHTININGTKMLAEDIVNILGSVISSLDKNREYNVFLEIK